MKFPRSPICLILFAIAAPHAPAEEASTGQRQEPADGVRAGGDVMAADAARLADLGQVILESCEAGRFADAHAAAREVVEIRKRVQGESHWETHSAAANLRTIEEIAALPPDAQRELAAAERLEKDMTQHFREGRYGDAIPLAARIVTIRHRYLGNDHQIVATALNESGICLHMAGDYDEAETQFRLAIDITQRVLGDGHPDLAACYGNLALSLQRQDKYSDAESLLQDAVAIQLRIHGPDHPDTAVAYTNIATNLDYQGRYDEAEPVYRQALDGLRKAYGEDHERTASAHNNLGFNLHRQAKDALADEQYHLALGIYRKVSGPDHPDTALVYNNLAASLADQGRYAQAEPLYRQALEIYGRILGADHPQTAATHNNLALTLNQQGKLAEAEALFRRALASRSMAGEENLSMAIWCTNLAYNLQAQDRHAEAKDLLDRALAIFRRVLGEDHVETAQGYNNLAAHHYKQAEFGDAESLIRSALGILERRLGKEHPLTAMAYGNLAVDLYAQGRYAEAEELQETSLAIFRRLYGPLHPNTAWAYRNLATLQWAQGNYQAAEESGNRAAESFAAARTRISFAGLDRASFSVENSPWPLLAAVAARNGKPSAAWRALENDLARGLLDDLSARPLTDDERQRELTLVRRLNRIDGEIAAAQPRDTVAQLNADRDAVQSELSQWQAELAGKYGVAVGDVYDLAHVQSRLAEDTAILTWVDDAGLFGNPDSQGEHWACVVRRRGDPAWIQLPGSGPAQTWTADDDRLPLELREHCSQRPTEISNRWKDLAGKLYDQRLRPVEAQLAARDGLPAVGHLVVLPAQSMRGIPVETLTDRYIVSYAPSATLFAWLQEKRESAERAESEPSILAVGDPEFTSAERPANITPPDASPRTPATELTRLQGTGTELRAITRVFGRSTILMGPEASKHHLDQWSEEGRLTQYRYLHFATHGVLDEESPMRSALILGASRAANSPEVTNGPAVDDGRLTAEQILRSWRLNADLVTLSACDTGLGKYSGGEGYLGFSQALFLAGARSMVVSLWQVDDFSTALLMTRFYENLMGARRNVKPMPKALALAEAKGWLQGLSADEIDRLSEGFPLGSKDEVTRGRRVPRPVRQPGTSDIHVYRHPYYWAGFILIGDPN